MRCAVLIQFWIFLFVFTSASQLLETRYSFMKHRSYKSTTSHTSAIDIDDDTSVTSQLLYYQRYHDYERAQAMNECGIDGVAVPSAEMDVEEGMDEEEKMYAGRCSKINRMYMFFVMCVCLIVPIAIHICMSMSVLLHIFVDAAFAVGAPPLCSLV